jgi:DNA repair exonuclease SbcCD ATPase subunit
VRQLALELARWRAARDAWEARQREHLERRAAVIRDLTLTAAALDDAEDGLADAVREQREAEAVAQVLGLKGARSHALVAALHGINKCASSWLARLGAPGARITLTPFTNLKSGAVRETLALSVGGLGKASSSEYRMLSGGERRRVDAALLLALAQVSAAAHGVEPGTVFFDEVFDALDSEGCEGISGALEDLATDRCVVVITHSDDLAANLVADGRLQIDQGIVHWEKMW